MADRSRPGDIPRTVRGTGLLCTPLRVEQAALRGRLTAPVVRTGAGPHGRVPATDRPLLVAGVAGALDNRLSPGDLVVSDLLRSSGARHLSHAAPLVAGALRRLGLPVHVGTIWSADHVLITTSRARQDDEAPPLAEPDHTTPADRADCAPDGHGLTPPSDALAVDTESAFLAAQAPPGLTVAVRAIVDTPGHPLVRPGTTWRGLAALRSLRAATPVLDQWVAATGERDVLLASPRSFCAGVERAIEIVERALQLHGAPVYVRRQVVHNRHVVTDLERRGAVFVTELDEVPRGSVAVLAAHGVAPSVRQQAIERELRVVDATCPLVAKVHQEVRRFASSDSTVFLIGHAEHEEVVGTRGEAPRNVIVVADPDEAERVGASDPSRVAYVMQTTLAVDEAERTAAVLRRRFPALRAPRRDDICYATTNRQRAVRSIARESDLVLVVGSQNSSNSHRLVEVAQAEGAAAHLVDDATDVDLRWLAGARRVGVTAGASAPSRLVDELVQCLSGLGPVHVHEAHVVDEDVRFTLPPEVSPR